MTAIVLYTMALYFMCLEIKYREASTDLAGGAILAIIAQFETNDKIKVLNRGDK